MGPEATRSTTSTQLRTSTRSTGRDDYLTFGDPCLGIRLTTRPADVRPTRASGRRRAATRVLLVAALDLGAVTTAVGMAYTLRYGAASPSGRVAELLPVFLLPPAWLLVLAGTGGFRHRGIGTTGFGVADVVRTFWYVAPLVGAACYLSGTPADRGLMLSAIALALVCDAGVRIAGNLWYRRRGGSRDNRSGVLAVGTAAAIAALGNDGPSDFHVNGAYVLDRAAGAEEDVSLGAGSDAADGTVADPVRRHVDAIAATAHAVGAAAVAVVSVGRLGSEGMRRLAWRLEGSGIELLVAAGLAEVAPRRLRLRRAGAMTLLYVREPEFWGPRRIAKSMIDRVLAVTALLVLLPLFFGLVVAVRLSSPGPAFFRQTRVGRHGRPFPMLKFRSMYVDAAARLDEVRCDNVYRAGPLFKLHDDPRVTRLGRVLRRYSLDELPQLINVLLGHMSLVGPRPPLPVEVAQYTPDVRRRLLVKPGITGLWQVSGRNDLSWRDSVRLDLHYVDNWSPALDLAVLWRTVAAVVRGTGAY